MTTNITHISFFTLSGLQHETKEIKYFIFSVTFICYFLIVFINVTLIVTIVQAQCLHEPMYLFLCNLCVNGLYGTVGFYPKFLADVFNGQCVISYEGCLLQAFVIHSSILCDYSILTVMAYDRYVAICRPLEYHSIMAKPAVMKFIVFPWMPAFVCEAVIILLTNRLILCGSSIQKLYCVNWPIVKLSCFSTTVNNVVSYNIIVVYLFQVLFILSSYIKLIRTCLKSTENSRKFMQTCLPHVFSLLNVTVAAFFDVMSSRYGSGTISTRLRNFLALEYLVIPPLLNPIIYGIQLTKLRNTLLRVNKNIINKVTLK